MSTHNEILGIIQYERKAVAGLYGSSTKSLTEEAICEMVWNMYPEEVVSNPEECYLDYACGMGNILLYGVEFLFLKLMKKIKEPKERLNHIIKNQLYGIDIDRSQIDIARSSFKRILRDPNASINIKCEDSLTKNFSKMKKKFNLGTNVPFQRGKDTNFYMKFRKDLNTRIADILKYKVIISPNYQTLTSNNNDNSNLAIYKDLGNAFKSITLPAGVCVTREDPLLTDKVEFTDLKGNTSVIEKDKFIVVADNSVIEIIEKVKQQQTLGSLYIHDANDISSEKENTNSNVFYVDKAGETNKDVKGFFVDESEGNVRSGSFVVFAYNAPGDPLDVGNKKLGPVKILKHGKYIFSGSVVALQLQSDFEALNCKKLLDSEWTKKIIRSVKYATNNSKKLLDVLPKIDFTKKFNEDDVIDQFR